MQDLGKSWYREDPEAATAWASANGVPLESFQSKNDTIRMTINGEEIEVPTGAATIEAGTQVLSIDEVANNPQFQAVKESLVRERLEAIENGASLDGALPGDGAVIELDTPQ